MNLEGTSFVSSIMGKMNELHFFSSLAGNITAVDYQWMLAYAEYVRKFFSSMYCSLEMDAREMRNALEHPTYVTALMMVMILDVAVLINAGSCQFYAK